MDIIVRYHKFCMFNLTNLTSRYRQKNNIIFNIYNTGKIEIRLASVCRMDCRGRTSGVLEQPLLGVDILQNLFNILLWMK